MPDRTGASGVNQARRISALRDYHSVSTMRAEAPVNLAKPQPVRIAWAGLGPRTPAAPRVRNPGTHGEGWFGLVLIILIGGGFAAGNIVLSQFLGPHNPSPEKSAPYECGM